MSVLRRRHPQITRRPPSSDDPVGDALAAAGEVTPRYPDDTLHLEDLRIIIGVEDLDPSRCGGFNTVVGFSDECTP
jgi:hypothetical protein